MKRLALITAIITLLASTAFTQEQPAPTVKPLGITAKLDYASTYLWRGGYFFGGDGALFPSLSYNILNSGAVVSLVGEFSESYFFEGQPRNRNAVAFANHGLDWGIDYSYTFDETFTLGTGFWFYWYFNSATSTGTDRTNLNFLSAKAFVKVDMLPLQPTVTLYYDYYTAIRRGGDFYVTLSMGHTFELTSEVGLGVSLSTGYYHQNTAKSTTFNGPSLSDIVFKPVKTGFSDITTLVTLNYQKGHVGLSGGFGYVIVPAKSWYKDSDVHRFYATFGVSFVY